MQKWRVNIGQNWMLYPMVPYSIAKGIRLCSKPRVINKVAQNWQTPFSPVICTTLIWINQLFTIFPWEVVHFSCQQALLQFAPFNGHLKIKSIPKSVKNRNFSTKAPSRVHVARAIPCTAYHSITCSIIYTMLFSPCRSGPRLPRYCTGIGPVSGKFSHFRPILQADLYM